MTYPLSGCVFIRNTFSGAYMLPESLAQMLPFVDELVVMDLGSDDGTLEFLSDIVRYNKKIKVISEGSFPYQDAGVFATLANDLIDFCKNQNVIYWQSDEIWHENLLKLMLQKFDEGQFDLSFWRIQYKQNFQYVKWFPHLVHRVGQKGPRFNFVGDGMNTDRVWDAKICSHYGGEYFPKWGDMKEEGIKPYVDEMITDVSLIGGFRDNIPARRRMHAPFWHEEPTIPDFNDLHKKESDWIQEAMNNPDWTKTESPYNLPKLLRYHIGKTKYELRPELLEAIRNDTTRAFLGI